MCGAIRANLIITIKRTGAIRSLLVQALSRRLAGSTYLYRFAGSPACFAHLADLQRLVEYVCFVGLAKTGHRTELAYFAGIAGPVHIMALDCLLDIAYSAGSGYIWHY